MAKVKKEVPFTLATYGKMPEAEKREIMFRSGPQQEHRQAFADNHAERNPFRIESFLFPRHRKANSRSIFAAGHEQTAGYQKMEASFKPAIREWGWNRNRFGVANQPPMQHRQPRRT